MAAMHCWPLLTLAILLLPAAAPADEARIAVATNFAAPARALAEQLQAGTPHALSLSLGSTGKLYAQISQGAPFDAFLAADEARPARLVRDGLALRGSQRTYALGRLVLWSPAPGLIGADGAATLAGGNFRRLAIANPDLAPYGRAAREVLDTLGLWSALGDRIVRGENAGQAFAMVASGNADLGFVPLSSLLAAPAGSRWPVPAELHAPIRQDAVLLTRGRDNPAALAYLALLASPEGRQLVETYGYRTE
jgi:molybdate transport system substrate-binding protein